MRGQRTNDFSSLFWISSDLIQLLSFNYLYKVNFIYHINHREFINKMSVSIIIPNKDQHNLLKNCIESILKKTRYPDYEIIIVENGSTEKKVFNYYESLDREHDNIKIITYQETFNFSAINNFASKEAEGEYLLFLNNDTVVINEDWLTAMVRILKNKKNGVAGATLLYDDDTVQHAGIATDPKWIAYHINHKITRENIPTKSMDVAGVTGACLLTTTDIFNKVGGFDENLPIAYNDVDFCLKVRDRGYKIKWTPNSLLYHYESKTRGLDDGTEKRARLKRESEYMRSKWKTKL